jgi:hypothetical protein
MLNRLKLSSKYIEKKMDFFGLKELSKILLVFILLHGCQKDDNAKRVVDSGNYAGTFEGANDLNIIQDSVYLNISNGYFIVLQIFHIIMEQEYWKFPKQY